MFSLLELQKSECLCFNVVNISLKTLKQSPTIATSTLTILFIDEGSISI